MNYKGNIFRFVTFFYIGYYSVHKKKKQWAHTHQKVGLIRSRVKIHYSKKGKKQNAKKYLKKRFNKQ